MQHIGVLLRAVNNCERNHTFRRQRTLYATCQPLIIPSPMQRHAFSECVEHERVASPTHGHTRPASPATIRQWGRRLNDDPTGYTFTPNERTTTRSPETHSTAMQTKSRMNNAETTQITG